MLRGGKKKPTELPIRRRVFVLLIALALLYLVLAVRITALTTVESISLTQRGVRQWTRDGIVYARRGEILDTNGQALVMSATAYIVSVDPRKVSDEALFVRTLCPVLELGLVGQTMHQIDERVPTAELLALTDIYRRVIETAPARLRMASN